MARTAIPLVLGTSADGEPISVPFFTATGTLSAVLGDPGLPKLLAIRALCAGARVQVLTVDPTPWLMMRDGSGLPAELITIAYPGTPPLSEGTRIDPWMIIDESGTPAAAVIRRPWQAFVAAPDVNTVTIAGMRGLDAIIMHRSTPSCRAAVIAAMDLPVPVTRSLHGIPGDVVAVACRGFVSLAPLTPDAAEIALLADYLPS
jgi:hypothetical protein